MITGITNPNHAMVIIGANVNEKTKKTDRWKVENSHGDTTTLKGFLTMSDSYFNDFMIVACVHKNALPINQRKLYKSLFPLTWLPFWDILGTYAESTQNT
jgi:bleomycin hydrolase